MKVLFFAPYVTCNEVPLLSQCKAGFGYMVYDIAKSIARTVQVEVLLTNYRYNSFDSDNIHFVAAKPWGFLKGLGNCVSIVRLLKLWVKYRMQFRSLIRLIYVWLISGYYYNVIKTGGYDIVHIHGCGFNEDILIDVCKKACVPYLFTLHGLNSFSESVNLELAGKRYERDFLKRVVDGEFPISVISSGIKKKIISAYKVDKCDNIHVVCNSFSFSDNVASGLNIRNHYHLPDSSYILLYVGNISRNKNQEQLIRAFEMMAEEEVSNTFILFCGRNIDEGYRLDDLISNSKYKSHYILCGNVDKELMPHYYTQANGAVLLSFSEGFGLSLIEGMHFGKPCMTFTDLDAFDDIYNPSCVIGVRDRNDTSVAEGLRILLLETWNESEIKKHSEKFWAGKMAENYINLYQNIIG